MKLPEPEYGHEIDDPFVINANLNEFLEVVPSELDRITDLFRNKMLIKYSAESEKINEEIWQITDFFKDKMLANYSGESERIIQERWHEYLTKDLGLEVIKSNTYLATPLDYLLDRIYSGTFDKVVIKDPINPSSPNFILMDRDFANKVLVLGGLP